MDVQCLCRKMKWLLRLWHQSDFWLWVGDIASNLFLGFQLLKKSCWVSAVLMWGQSEWSVFLSKISGSTNETPVIFSSFILQALEWLLLLGEIGNKRQSLELCQYPPTEWVWGNIQQGIRADIQGEEQTVKRSCQKPRPPLSPSSLGWTLFIVFKCCEISCLLL